jgi:hypothetical protein
MAITNAVRIAGMGTTGGNIFTSSAAPAVTDDISAGYKVGDMVIRTDVAKTAYLCTNNGAGAAVWAIFTLT